MNHLPWHYHRRTVISTHSLIPRDVDVDDTKDGSQSQPPLSPLLSP